MFELAVERFRDVAAIITPQSFLTPLMMAFWPALTKEKLQACRHLRQRLATLNCPKILPNPLNFLAAPRLPLAFGLLNQSQPGRDPAEVFVRKVWVVWQILGLVVTLNLAASFFSPVWAEENSESFDGDGERIELPLENSTIQRTADVLTIQVGKNTYVIPNGTPDQAAWERFSQMSVTQQQRFYQNRDMFISNTAKILRRVGWTFGIGSILANKIVMIKDKVMAPVRALKAIKNMDTFDPAQLADADESFYDQPEAKRKEAFNERSRRIITSILTAMNRQLWSQAPLVGDANEFGVNLSVGVAAEGGHARKGWGGQFEIGLSFGYNKESKAFVFQVYRNVEKFKSTLMPAIFFAGITPKAAIVVSQTKEGAIHSRVGSTSYPPGFPAFLSTTPTMFASGFNSGIGFPPPPFGDMLAYTNSLDNKAIIRVIVSPTLKGFVRVQFGLGLNSLKVFLQPITAVKSWIGRLFGSGLCKGVFVN